MKCILETSIVNRFQPLAKAMMIAGFAFGITSCSFLPFIGKANPSEVEPIVESLQEEESESSKYGFKHEAKTVEDDILIRRFELDKSNLDHAITNTKDLISKSHGKPFLPELYIRLAELYAEKSRVVFFLRRLEMGERGKVREISSIEAAGLKEKAVETYLQIVSHFPEFEYLDKVHFFLAHEFRELGKYTDMVEQYEEILKTYPLSEFVPESLLLLGDHAYQDKNIDQALGYYQRVLQYPKSSAIVIARYKLAWVHINKRNYAQALSLFEKSVANKDVPSTVDVDTYNRVDIRLEALADMAFTYSQVYKDTKPGDDSAYFKNIAWSRQSYILVLEKLANRYMIKHKWDNASYIYRELSAMQSDGTKLLHYLENLYTCLLESKNFGGSENDIVLIVKALDQVRYSVHMDESKKVELMTVYELYARDVATRLHNNAKKTNEVDDYRVAASVYKKYLDFFDESPKYAEIQINYAESLFASGDHTRAGKVYETIASTISDPKVRHDPLYSAAAAYYTALNNIGDLNHYEIAFSQDGLRDVGQTYVGLYPSSSKSEDILFNIARIQYDKGEFQAAVEEFSAFVKKYPKGSNAKAAVELIMDSLNITENYDALMDLEQDIAEIPGLDSGVKQNIAKVSKAAQAKIIQEMVVGSINDWDSGKEKLINFADSNKTAGLGIQALNALFVSSEEHGDIESMHVAGQSIASRFSGTEHAENALRALIDLSLTTANYRVLADYLEQYVLQFPKSVNSKDFLFQAAQIRGNLKQNSLAISNYNKVLNNYKIDNKFREQIVLALIASHDELGEREQAYRVLAKNKRALNTGTLAALGAELSYYTGRSGPTLQYLKNARKMSAQGKVPSEYYEPLGRTAYALAFRSYDRYMKVRLGAQIDNRIVESKTQLQEQLQDDFITAINFKSPRWSVLACYRIYEINLEYARFLEGAPQPEGFTSDEISQYKQIIAEKALEYRNEAAQYLKTGEDIARRTKPLDRQISTYDIEAERSFVRNASFSQRQKQTQIGLETLKDTEFRAIFDSLYRAPGDVDLLLALANKYRQRGDLGQTLVIAKTLLEDTRKLGSKRRSEVYSVMGAVYMDMGHDRLARDSLQKSLDIDKSNYSAAVNLAGLYYHYGYKDYANGLYSKRIGLKKKEDTVLIISRAERFFNAPD